MGRKRAAASRMCTGDREKRRCGGPGRLSGDGEQQQQAGSQGKLQGSGESGDSARLKKVGLDEERSDGTRGAPGTRRGHDPPPPPPLWQRRFTGVHTLEALGRQAERHRDRSSGTDSERQWRLGGGGGGGGAPAKQRSVTDVLGTRRRRSASPCGRPAQGGSGPQERLGTSCTVGWEGGHTCQLLSVQEKKRKGFF